MKTYQVTLPIAGHAFVDVEAESEEDAIAKAHDEVTRDDIGEWEVKEDCRGNVCCFPSPWHVEVQCIDEEDAEP